MTGAMYAAISGLKAHMSKLNVIGNNIANVNTHGYKSQRYIFHETLYTTSRGGSNGTTTVGGRNPAQIGYGSVTGTIDLDMSTSTYSPGLATDLMIDGDGFLLTGSKDIADVIDPSNPESLKSLTLTRLGDLKIGPDGYLVNGTGDVVYGFLSTGVDKNGDPMMCDQLVPIRIPRMYEKDVVDPTDPTKILHKKGSPIFPNGPSVKDEDGNLIVKREAANGGTASIEDGWPMKVAADGTESPDYGDLAGAGGAGGAGTTTVPDESENTTARLAYDSFTIDENTGAITVVSKETDENIIIGYIAVGNVTNPNGVTHVGGPNYKCQAGAGDLKVCLLGGVAKDLGLETINGTTLVRNDDGTYPADGKSPARGMTVDDAGTTKFVTGGLENSKADLATEIAEMITTQRGYQANTRIITVTDSMLEELVNMKR